MKKRENTRRRSRARAILLWLGGLAVAALVAVELIGGAARSAGPASLDHGGLEVRHLTGSVIDASEELGLPMALALVGDHLVVADGHLDPTLHLLRRSDGQRVAAFGRGGEGPGEFRAPRSLPRAPGREDAFWLYDMQLRRLTLVELADAAAPDPDREARARTLHLHSDAVVTDLVFLPDGRSLVALGFFREGRLARFDSAGEKLGVHGPLPPAEGDVPPDVLQHAYQGRMAGRPDGERLAVGSRHAGRLEILSPRGDLLALAEVPFEFSPRFQVAVTDHGPRMASGADLRFGYIDVAATTARIYGLFSGRLRGPHGGRGPYGRHVHVFDWSGRLVEVLELDGDAFALTVTDDDGALYAVRHHPVPAVLRYGLDGDR